ncbi:hypothetical protein P9B03_13490 [Metasolibacillus meyeri]|uniref:Pre-toxin TG domain-containing protein n=1 Tax=Metasolibacillus meyeri TaxID=1071052 RepID=A0AAW9NW69_9BACL|nr:hypothetical protein [Metasolibacillus meyeri]MEC1179506.1 hypothetical protein [Metasolibacillus meyeri]
MELASNPKAAWNNLTTAIAHPKETVKAMGKAVQETVEKDYVQGNAYSRSYVEGEAILGVGTALVGTKGLGSLTKIGKVPELDKGTVKLNPNEIRFSQNSVNGSQEITESMNNNGWVGDPIDVVRMSDGGLTTIDNTRVVVARAAGFDVQAVVRNADDLLPEHLIERFTTKKGVPTTWGEAIEMRIGKQSSGFKTNNPYGSFEMEKIK